MNAPSSYEDRVLLYEAQGATRSDAQGMVDAEDLHPDALEVNARPVVLIGGNAYTLGCEGELMHAPIDTSGRIVHEQWTEVSAIAAAPRQAAVARAVLEAGEASAPCLDCNIEFKSEDQARDAAEILAEYFPVILMGETVSDESRSRGGRRFYLSVYGGPGAAAAAMADPNKEAVWVHGREQAS